MRKPRDCGVVGDGPSDLPIQTTRDCARHPAGRGLAGLVGQNTGKGDEGRSLLKPTDSERLESNLSTAVGNVEEGGADWRRGHSTSNSDLEELDGIGSYY